MCSRKVFLIILLAFVVSFVGNAYAVVESQGIDGYGWQQVWGGTDPHNFERLTGSSDRRSYDVGGPKEIQIFGRHEDYWSQDCGWWYIGNESAVSNITIVDNGSVTVLTDTSLTTTKGTAFVNYTWGDNTSGTQKPGRWTVIVKDGLNTATFYVWARGQLDVVSVTGDGTYTVGSSETVTATIKDHGGLTVDTNTNKPLPSATMYVSGANYYDNVTMTAGSGTWTGSFTPPYPGTYKITVEAGDGHDKWQTGRGSMSMPVSGPFPASFYGSGANIIALLVLSILLSMQINSRIRRKNE